jgi:hypothetical protein
MAERLVEVSRSAVPCHRGCGPDGTVNEDDLQIRRLMPSKVRILDEVGGYGIDRE